MGVEFIPAQNVTFVNPNDEDFNEANKKCTRDPRTYCQPVEYLTETKFWIKLTDKTGINFITNPTFDTDLTDWTTRGSVAWDTGKACLDGDGLGVDEIEQTVTGLTTNNWYKIVYTISDWRDCYATPGYATLSVTNGTVFGISTVVFSANGTYTAYFIANSTSVDVTFSIGTCAYFCLDDVYLVDYSRADAITITIEDCDGNFAKTITDYQTNGDYALISVDWKDLAEGCYKICIDGIGDLTYNYLEDAVALDDQSGREITLEQRDQNGRPINLDWT